MCFFSKFWQNKQKNTQKSAKGDEKLQNYDQNQELEPFFTKTHRIQQNLANMRPKHAILM